MSKPAFPGPYTDLTITVREPAHVTITPNPPFTQDQAQTASYDPAGRQYAGGADAGFFSETAPAIQAPSTWKIGRDPYKVGGAVGQTFFNNQA